MRKKTAKKLKKGEVADFKVIEFNKEFKRVVASHTATFRDEEEKNVRNNNNSEMTSSSNAEKTTLGDLDALSQLKERMEKGEQK